jgi:hypothetical protein
MTDRPGASPVELVRWQLQMLDLFESLLRTGLWDEDRMNATVKTLMSSVLAAIRLQRSFGEQLQAAQSDLLRAYRAQLQHWLETNGDSMDARPAKDGSPMPPEDGSGARP